MKMQARHARGAKAGLLGEGIRTIPNLAHPSNTVNLPGLVETVDAPPWGGAGGGYRGWGARWPRIKNPAGAGFFVRLSRRCRPDRPAALHRRPSR